MQTDIFQLLEDGDRRGNAIFLAGVQYDSERHFYTDADDFCGRSSGPIINDGYGVQLSGM